MKALGMYRKIDDLGRIVLPAELRKLFGIEEGDKLEIFVNDDAQIVLSKIEESCAICGGSERLVQVRGRQVCASCRRHIGALRR
jgi:AbrB family transcriptional regulator, transcriptional pleiotropic regulator of transition state genes